MGMVVSLGAFARSFPRGGVTGLLALQALAAAAMAQTLPAVRRGTDWALAAPKFPVYEVVPLDGEASPAPPALALVPGGSFWMGNSFTNLYPLEGFAKELPLHEVPVSPFFIGRFEITNLEMAEILQWAYTNGLVTVVPTVTTNGVTNFYGSVRNTEGTQRELVDLDGYGCQVAFTNGAFAVAAGKTNFPCIRVTWHGALAYCNFLSDRHGLPRAVDFSPADWGIDITSAGYRLPTEAEWEKACRGDNPGTHFPWPDDSQQGTNVYLYSIDPVKANYADIRYLFVSNATVILTNHPMHPWFNEPVRTTPVGYYNGAQVITNLSTNITYRGADYGQTNDMANGYGLYDMAGNVYEWCVDYLGTNWYANPAASLPDPTGPAAGESFFFQRVARGGGWNTYLTTQAPDPSFQRCAFRDASYPANWADVILGFRVARRPTAYESWALGTGLDPLATNGVAEADFDGDRQPNGAEWVAGTHPTNPASFFRVDGLNPAGTPAWVSCLGVSGRVYTVESTTNLLADDWQFASELTNTAAGEIELPVDTAAERQYLRIRARLAP